MLQWKNHNVKNASRRIRKTHGIHQKSQLLENSRKYISGILFCRIFIINSEEDRIGYDWKMEKLHDW